MQLLAIRQRECDIPMFRLRLRAYDLWCCFVATLWRVRWLRGRRTCSGGDTGGLHHLGVRGALLAARELALHPQGVLVTPHLRPLALRHHSLLTRVCRRRKKNIRRACHIELCGTKQEVTYR